MAKAIPAGLHSVTPAMSVDGAAAALAFYKKAFGAKETRRAPDPSGKKIWHAEFQIGDSRIFINDVFPEMGGTAAISRLWIYTPQVDALWKRAVKAGCKIRMPIADMFWGDRVGTLTDRWGNEWTLAKHLRDLTAKQMQKAQDDFVAQQHDHR